MKKFFIIPLAGVLALSACTDDVPVIELPGQGGEVTGYVALNIKADNSFGSRADADDPSASRAFVQATLDESYIDHVDLYFFNDAGAAVRDPQRIMAESDGQWSETDHSGSTELGHGPRVYPVNAGNLFTQIVAVANGESFGRINKAELLGKTIKNARVFPTTDMGDWYNAPARGQFLSTSSVYYRDGSMADATKITTASYYPTEAEALAHPVNIYIERVLAKVTVKPNGFDGGNKVQHKLDANSVYNFSPSDVSVNLLNWWVSNIPIGARLFKGHDGAWVGNAALNGANGTGNRSFWADPWRNDAWVNRSSYVLPWTNARHANSDDNDLPYHGENKPSDDPSSFSSSPCTFYNFPAYVDVTDTRADNIKRLYDFSQDIYMPENTTFTGANDGTTASTASSICLLAQIKIGGQAYDLVKWGGKLYKETDFRATMAALINSMGYRLNGAPFGSDLQGAMWISRINDENGFLNMPGAPYYQYNPGIVQHTIMVSRSYGFDDPNLDPYRMKQWEDALVFNNGSAISKVDPNNPSTVILADARAELNLLLMSDRWRVWFFDKGFSYYFRNIESGLEGSYSRGVVRNHWYEMTVNSITGLGTPIPTPVDVIVPERPEDDGYYIEATTRFLPWRYQYNSINLED